MSCRSSRARVLESGVTGSARFGLPGRSSRKLPSGTLFEMLIVERRAETRALAGLVAGASSALLSQFSVVYETPSAASLLSGLLCVWLGLNRLFLT